MPAVPVDKELAVLGQDLGIGGILGQVLHFARIVLHIDQLLAMLALRIDHIFVAQVRAITNFLLSVIVPRRQEGSMCPSAIGRRLRPCKGGSETAIPAKSHKVGMRSSVVDTRCWPVNYAGRRGEPLRATINGTRDASS